MLELITDRTQEDVNRAKELNQKVYAAFASMAAVVTANTDVLIEPLEIVQSALTAEEFAEWKSGLKGAYNYMDLNRVESAVEKVSSFLGYGMTTKTDWKMSDEITHAEMMRYLSNLQTLKEKCGSSMPIPQNMSQLTYQSANNIEKMLLDAYEYKNTYSAGKLSIGNILWFDVSGISKEFIVVHQGNPDSSLYDASCDGTWLLMKELYTTREWNASQVGYQKSSINTYLNNNFLGLLNDNVQAAIKQVKIPYSTGTGTDSTVVSGSNGLPTKVFLPASYEVGFVNTPSSDARHVDGSKLDYFIEGATSAASNLRKGYFNGTGIGWWLRTLPSEIYSGSAWFVTDSGDDAVDIISTAKGIRPMFILDSNTPIANLTEKIS